MKKISKKLEKDRTKRLEEEKVIPDGDNAGYTNSTYIYFSQ